MSKARRSMSPRTDGPGGVPPEEEAEAWRRAALDPRFVADQEAFLDLAAGVDSELIDELTSLEHVHEYQ